MAKKAKVEGFNTSLLSLNRTGTTHRTLLVLIVIAVLVVVGNVQGGAANAIDGIPLQNATIGLFLFAVGFLAYDALFVRLSRRYPVALGFDKVLLLGTEGLFVALLTMTGVLTWIAADTEIIGATLVSSSVLLSIFAVAMLPLRYGLGAIAADKGWVRKPKTVKKKRR